MGEKIVKGVAFRVVLLFLLSVTVGMASALSNSCGGDWKYYKAITIKGGEVT